MPTIKTTVEVKRRVDTNAIKTTYPDKYPGVYSTKQILINIVSDKSNYTVCRPYREKITPNATATNTFFFKAAGMKLFLIQLKSK